MTYKPFNLPYGLIGKYEDDAIRIQRTFEDISSKLNEIIRYENDSGLWLNSLLKDTVAEERLGAQIVGFTRNSVAYKQDGTQAAANLPRYETGRFGQALMMEEGTTNLLTANQSNIETSLDAGFIPAGTGTVTRDITQAWQGSASIKVVTDTDASAGVDLWNGVPGTGFPVTAGQTYTASIYAKGNAGGEIIGVSLYASDWTYIASSSIVTLTTSWQRISVTGTIPTGKTAVFILVRKHADVAVRTWFVDGLQIEQKSYATSWTLGGTTRSAETLTIPTAGVFTKGNWAVEMTFEPTSKQDISGRESWLLRCLIDTSNYYDLYIPSTGKPYLRIKSGGVFYNTNNTNSPILQVGTKYSFMISGDGYYMRFCINGVQMGSDTVYIEPVGTLPTFMYVGDSTFGTNQCNGLIDDLRFSSRARTALEHYNAYTASVPLPVDDATTLKQNFDNTLRPTVRSRANEEETWYATATNFDTRNDRISTVPANPVIATDGIAVDHTINTDGSANISLEWTYTGTGDAYNIDGFTIYVYVSSVNTPYVIGTTPPEEQAYYVPADKRAFILYGQPANKYYTFGVQAYRMVDKDINANEILKSAIVQPSIAGENPYQPSVNVAFAGDITGTVNGTPASTVSTVATNFNNRNDRKSTVPANPNILSDGTAVDHVINTDGSADISIEWGHSGTGDAYDIDGFVIYIYSSTTSTAYTFGTTPAEEQVYYVSSEKRAFILRGVAADKYYTFGVQAYRMVDQDINSAGIIKSTIVKSTATGENPYQPSVNVAFAGNVTGTINGVAASTVQSQAGNSVQQSTSYNSVTITTADGLKVSHTDGSYTQMTGAGIKRYIAGTGRSYHYLIYANTQSTFGVSPYTNPPPDVTVQLGSEFYGKEWDVLVSVKGTPDAIGKITLFVVSKNTAAGTFVVRGYTLDASYRYGGVEFSYLAIA